MKKIGRKLMEFVVRDDVASGACLGVLGLWSKYEDLIMRLIADRSRFEGEETALDRIEQVIGTNRAWSRGNFLKRIRCQILGHQGLVGSSRG